LRSRSRLRGAIEIGYLDTWEIPPEEQCSPHPFPDIVANEEIKLVKKAKKKKKKLKKRPERSPSNKSKKKPKRNLKKKS